MRPVYPPSPCFKSSCFVSPGTKCLDWYIREHVGICEVIRPYCVPRTRPFLCTLQPRAFRRLRIYIQIRHGGLAARRADFRALVGPAWHAHAHGAPRRYYTSIGDGIAPPEIITIELDHANRSTLARHVGKLQNMLVSPADASLPEVLLGGRKMTTPKMMLNGTVYR